ncbi:MAG: DegT/DnrJ/EryC1/StrS aminotransferase family protein [Robiginitomaculum sp.]|nr:DegT/DnrJ/EryC1/StrS aminotransferase family protein [Robiginitomaculum sp.]
MAFIDLQAQRSRIEDKINSAVLNAVADGKYVMGPQVKELEAKLAEFGKAKHVLACGNGTDALVLPMMAWGIGEGDAVFCPSFTFVATGEIVPWINATPVFVDILPDTYNMDPENLETAIKAVIAAGELTPKVIIAVDLFGQPANYPVISAIAKKYGMKLIADSAQGFGSTLHGKHPLHWADAATTSFFPAKPLGCYGDGGAVLTDCDETAAAIDSIRVHGKGTDKYDNVRIGVNSRLDTIQAAILLEKLAIFADEIEKRNEIARAYNAGLGNIVKQVPRVIDGGISVWAQYTIEVENREELGAYLKDRGIPTAVYYPKPIHMQTAYSDFPVGDGGVAVSEEKAKTVISLPMHPYLAKDDINKIINAIQDFYI